MKPYMIGECGFGAYRSLVLKQVHKSGIENGDECEDKPIGSHAEKVDFCFGGHMFDFMVA